MKKALLALFAITLCINAFSQFKIGDKVEAWNSNWYPRIVKAAGADNYQGYYLVKWDTYSGQQWIAAKNIRYPKNAAQVTETLPRNGKYRILSYGSNPANPIYLGYFTLESGAYSYYNAANALLGNGKYSYDGNSKTINWTSGPFNANKWNGRFEISREGKTHIIRLNSRTIGTNTIESK